MKKNANTITLLLATSIIIVIFLVVLMFFGAKNSLDISESKIDAKWARIYNEYSFLNTQISQLTKEALRINLWDHDTQVALRRIETESIRIGDEFSRSRNFDRMKNAIAEAEDLNHIFTELFENNAQNLEILSKYPSLYDSFAKILAQKQKVIEYKNEYESSLEQHNRRIQTFPINLFVTEESLIESHFS